MKDVQQAGDAVLAELEKVVFGKSSTLRLMIAALFAGGHVLLEDVPGTAKTLAAKALSKAVGGNFQRVQGTPDLLPGDVTGSSIYDPRSQSFVFHPGPVFANVLLADEINRATPRAQAALLECMAERQVSVDGKTRPLPAPFFVLATQNPVEQEGTFPLPEAQLDRFLMRLSFGYPAVEAEAKMLAEDREDPLSVVQPVLDAERLVALQRRIREVHAADDIRTYAVRLVGATRKSEELLLGGGPRATKALYRSGQAWAALAGRDWLSPDDLKRMLTAVLGHRVILGPDARLAGRDAEAVVEKAVRLVPAPSVRR